MKIRLILVTLLGLIYVGQSSAIIITPGKKRTSSKQIINSPSDSSASSISTKIEKVSVKKSSPKECSDGNYVPLKLLGLLTEGETEPFVVEDNIKSSETPKKVKVIQQPYLKTCTQFRYELAQSEGNNNLVFSVVNDFNFDDFLVGKTVKINGKDVVLDKEQLGKMSSNDKYEACLISKGVLVPKGGSDYELVYPEADSEYTKLAETFEVTFDPQKPMKMIFGSPQFLGGKYGPEYERVKGPSVGGLECFMLEEVSEDKKTLFSEVDIELSKYLDICEKGNHKEIRAALKSVGNASSLRQILEKALERELVAMGETNYKRLIELGDIIAKAKDEETIRGVVDEYVEKLVELKKYIVEPSIARLEELIKKRNSARSEKERADLDESIYALNMQIGYYAKNEAKMKSKQILDKLLEHGFRDAAEEIAEFKLRSHHFSGVYVESGKKAQRGRPEKMSFEKATRLTEQQQKVFALRAAETERAYNAKQGNNVYTPEINMGIGRLTSQRDGQWSSDMARIQENFEACQATFFGFMKNPARCDYAMRNKDRWVQEAYARRGVFNRAIKQQQDRLERFGMWEEEGKRKQMAENPDAGMFPGESSLLGSYGMYDYGIGNYGGQRAGYGGYGGGYSGYGGDPGPASYGRPAMPQNYGYGMGGGMMGGYGGMGGGMMGGYGGMGGGMMGGYGGMGGGMMGPSPYQAQGNQFMMMQDPYGRPWGY